MKKERERHTQESQFKIDSDEFCMTKRKHTEIVIVGILTLILILFVHDLW